ncbi:hypothetical protein IFM89_024957 [Coptis chinensis]|uniref:Uncharacterized protein n=1 Tax=Coptis chinensis TaxID=261450 RepID=A0A835IRH3_9MAGN|nr:hypothetical protein IFM89_024957 [Coptis chinensis]
MSGEAMLSGGLSDWTLETSHGAVRAVTRKTRLLDVVYNASNNELVRTQTLVKSHHSSRQLHHLGSEYFIKTTKKQVSVVTRDSEGNIARDLACQIEMLSESIDETLDKDEAEEET